MIEDADGTLRMWYSGHDGSTGRILEALQEPGQDWRRVGLSLDAGAAGSSDSYGVEAPSVVRTPGGFLMAYAGSDGAGTRLHMATSDDGHRWEAHGTIMHRGESDAVGATHPCLVVTSGCWWLFYAGYDGSDASRRAQIMAAVSPDGASWDRVGTVLAPSAAEVALSEPSVLVRQRHFTMLYVSDDGTRSVVDMASSGDGVSWNRRGTTLGRSPAGPETTGIRGPSVLNLHHGGLRLWYSARAPSDEVDGCRLWSADFVRPPPAARTGPA